MTNRKKVPIQSPPAPEYPSRGEAGVHRRRFLSIVGHGAIAAVFLGGCDDESGPKPATEPREVKPEIEVGRQVVPQTPNAGTRKETDRLGGLLAAPSRGDQQENSNEDDRLGGQVSRPVDGSESEVFLRRAVLKRKAPQVIGGEGSIDHREVHSTVWDHKDELIRCYKAGIKKDKDLTGKITPQLKIGARGKVISAKTALNELGPIVERCVLRKMRKIRFPKPEGGSVVVEFPMMFVQI